MEFELIEVLEPDETDEADRPERGLRREQPGFLLGPQDDLIAPWAIELPEQEYG